MTTGNTIIRAQFEALPEYSIGCRVRAVTDPQTGETRPEREPQRFLARRDVCTVVDADGQVWTVFTDQDGVRWRERAE